MFIDRSGNLWLGTSKGLFFYEYNNSQFEKLQLHSQLSDKRISVIEQGPDSTFWIGSDSGLFFGIKILIISLPSRRGQLQRE